jgi:hypothetical protein
MLYLGLTENLARVQNMFTRANLYQLRRDIAFGGSTGCSRIGSRASNSAPTPDFDRKLDGIVRRVGCSKTSLVAWSRSIRVPRVRCARDSKKRSR